MINGEKCFDQPIKKIRKQHTKTSEKLLQVKEMTIQLVVY